VQTDFNKTLFLETCTMNEDPFKLYDPRRAIVLISLNL
jgi:hypothetical protein